MRSVFSCRKPTQNPEQNEREKLPHAVESESFKAARGALVFWCLWQVPSLSFLISAALDSFRSDLYLLLCCTVGSAEQSQPLVPLPQDAWLKHWTQFLIFDLIYPHAWDKAPPDFQNTLGADITESCWCFLALLWCCHHLLAVSALREGAAEPSPLLEIQVSTWLFKLDSALKFSTSENVCVW